MATAAKKVKAVATPLAIPRIGEVWPEQGGIYIGLVRGETGQPDHHLILPTDSRASFKEVAWGKAGKTITKAANLRDGLANTLAMAKAGSELAKNIRALEIDGVADFYLPSRHEARLCYLNAPEQFETDDWYWTSTQYSANYAWMQYVDDGNQFTSAKGSPAGARAVRRFISNSSL